jgi:hypothetical protein
VSVTLYCQRHPNYRALREPRTPCPGCWTLWLASQRQDIGRVSDLDADEPPVK